MHVGQSVKVKLAYKRPFSARVGFTGKHEPGHITSQRQVIPVISMIALFGTEILSDLPRTRPLKLPLVNAAAIAAISKVSTALY